MKWTGSENEKYFASCEALELSLFNLYPVGHDEEN